MTERTKDMNTPNEPITALAERVEALTGPCRETDELISAAIVGAIREVTPSGRTAYHTDDGSRWCGVEVKPYTASIDQAMTLVPEGACWRLDTMLGVAFCYRPFGGMNARGVAFTPALALCAAALRARSA